MDFPIIDLLDDEQSIAWLEHHFHPTGQQCPHCHAARADARFFRINSGSGLPVWRCHQCQGMYNLYSGTIFAESQLAPVHMLLLLRGVLQGQPSAQLARGIGLTEKTVLKWRQRLQARAEQLQPQTPLPDHATESDEMFQHAGEIGDAHCDPADPPRRRANKRRGRGTYAHDRPPSVGTVGRATGQLPCGSCVTPKARRCERMSTSSRVRGAMSTRPKPSEHATRGKLRPLKQAITQEKRSSQALLAGASRRAALDRRRMWPE